MLNSREMAFSVGGEFSRTHSPIQNDYVLASVATTSVVGPWFETSRITLPLTLTYHLPWFGFDDKMNKVAREQRVQTSGSMYLIVKILFCCKTNQ